MIRGITFGVRSLIRGELTIQVVLIIEDCTEESYKRGTTIQVVLIIEDCTEESYKRGTTIQVVLIIEDCTVTVG